MTLWISPRCLLMLAIFAWGIVSARVAAISTPIFFVAVGLLIAEGLRLVDLEPDPHSTKIIAEATLVWVLFADASRVRFADLREDLGHYGRLVAIGLPLTTALGAAAAAAMLGLSRGMRCLWAPLLPRPTRLLARRSAFTVHRRWSRRATVEVARPSRAPTPAPTTMSLG